MAAPNVSLETAFSRIQSGNELESQGQNWEAAFEFFQAHQILNNLSAGSNDEKITDLYQQQAREYFIRSRQVLMAAMKHENDQDSQDAKAPFLFQSTVTDAELEKRTTLFASLFARLPSIAVSSTGKALSEKSLEERLMQLNENLPKGFKTSEQRMADINRGLNRLGLSLYSHSDNKPAIEPPKSESQQIEDIIAQAKDEVRLTGGEHLSSSVLPAAAAISVQPSSQEVRDSAFMNGEHVDFAESDLESNDEVKSSAGSGGESNNADSEEEEETELTPQQIVKIREHAVDAQAELAQLLALLEMDEAGDAEIEFEQQVGLASLFKARKSLQKAAMEWKKQQSS